MSPIASSDPCSALLSGIGNLIFPLCCAFVPRAHSWSMRPPDCSFQVHAQPSSGSWPLGLAAIDTSLECASLFLVLFGSPFLLPNWSRTLPLLTDQVLDLATSIGCPTLCFLPSPRRNIHFRLWKEIWSFKQCYIIPVVDLRVTAQPAWSLSTCTRILLGIRCSAKIWVKSGHFLRNLSSLLRSLHLASVHLTIPRARSFTVCEMSGRSCDRYAARITHDRYVFARSFPRIGLLDSSICWSTDFFTSGVSTPSAVSRPNSRIKRSTCLLSGSKKTACRPLCFPTLIKRFRKWISRSSRSSNPKVPSRFSSYALRNRPSISCIVLGCRSTPESRHRVRRSLFHHFHDGTRLRLNGPALCCPIPASWCNDSAKYWVRPASHTWTSSIDHTPSHQIPCTTHPHRATRCRWSFSEYQKSVSQLIGVQDLTFYQCLENFLLFRQSSSFHLGSLGQSARLWWSTSTTISLRFTECLNSCFSWSLFTLSRTRFWLSQWRSAPDCQCPWPLTRLWCLGPLLLSATCCSLSHRPLQFNPLFRIIWEHWLFLLSSRTLVWSSNCLRGPLPSLPSFLVSLEPCAALLISLHEFHYPDSASLCVWNHSWFIHQHTCTPWAPCGTLRCSHTCSRLLFYQSHSHKSRSLASPIRASPRSTGLLAATSQGSSGSSLKSSVVHWSAGLSLRIPCPRTTPESAISN